MLEAFDEFNTAGNLLHCRFCRFLYPAYLLIDSHVNEKFSCSCMIDSELSEIKQYFFGDNKEESSLSPCH